MNLFSILEESARKWPGDPAVVHDGRTFRYSELYDAAESLAGKLRETGLQAGDKVGVLCPNGPEYLVAVFAVLRLGGVVVPIPAGLKAGEVAGLVDTTAPDGFCYNPRFGSFFQGVGQERLTEARIFPGGEPAVIRLARNRNTPGWERQELLKRDIATIRFSSGTTSQAKGMLLSHGALLERVKTHIQNPPMGKSDTILWLRLLTRNFPTTILAALMQGTRVVLGDAMNTSGLAALLREYAVTQIYASPMFYQTVLNDPDISVEDLHGVEFFLSTGSWLPKVVAEEFLARFGRAVVEHYGLAETSRVFFFPREGGHRRGSVGKVIDGYEVKLVPVGSAPSDGDEVGELFVRGPSMFDAYYKPWRSRDEVLEDGWFRTGDIARRDKDGYYWIVGRTKDVINVGGVKVFPSEIEEALLTHPAVEEAVVYGVAEGRFGEVPHAKVKLRVGTRCTEREIMRHVNEKLSVFKSLRGVEFVEEIPKTATGKPKRVGA